MPKISPLSQVDARASLADDVEVGPFCVVGPQVRLGAGCRLLSHVSITGNTTIGTANTFFPNSVIGAVPQDLKYRGGDTLLEIGNNNSFREGVTVHIGTEQGGRVTRIGNENLIMVNVHIGHDVQIANRCIISNNVMFAGHVVVGRNVAIMGGAAFHHFVTIGDFAYVGGYAAVSHDVPPFVRVDGPGKVRALNAVGLRRAGFTEDDISCLEGAVRRLFISKRAPFSVTLAEYDTLNGLNPHVKHLVEFLRRRDLDKNGRYLETQRTSSN